MYLCLQWTETFPNQMESEKESLHFVKKLLAISVSNIAYLRSIFPERAFGDRTLEGIYYMLLFLVVNLSSCKMFTKISCSLGFQKLNCHISLQLLIYTKVKLVHLLFALNLQLTVTHVLSVQLFMKYELFNRTVSSQEIKWSKVSVRSHKPRGEMFQMTVRDSKAAGSEHLYLWT